MASQPSQTTQPSPSRASRSRSQPENLVAHEAAGGIQPEASDFDSEGEDEIVQYSESDWAQQFVGHLVHRCVVLICRAYYPSLEEQEDPELFARNVQEVMLK